MQRSAGNRAVGAMLARQPGPTAPKAPPKDEDRAATMTAGLGDEIGVIPIDSFAWADGHVGPAGRAGDAGPRELTIEFGPNPVVPQIAHAGTAGKFIGKAFVSTQTVTFDLDDTILTGFRQSGNGSDGHATTYSVTLNFASLQIRQPG